MKVLQIRIFALFIATIFSGCATIMGSTQETLNVRSTPGQAKVVVIDESGAKIFEGRTPTSFPLQKKKGYFSGKTYDVKVSKEGYGEEKTITVDTKLSGWYAGNILFGGLIGLLVLDPATGAMWTLSTQEIDVDFGNSLKQSMLNHDVLFLHDIPLALRDKLIEIPQQ